MKPVASLLAGLFDRGTLPEHLLLTAPDDMFPAGTVFSWHLTGYRSPCGDYWMLPAMARTRFRAGLLRETTPPAPKLVQGALL